MNAINYITLADSYKYSHSKQYPKNMVSMFDYAEARSDKVYQQTVFFGMQMYIKKYLQNAVNMEMVERAQKMATKHGIPFDYEGWSYIAKLGFLPVKIRAVPEGSVIPTGHPLFTIESTDKKVPWIAGFLETLLMKIWYPSNVATRSYDVRKTLQSYWDKSVDEKDAFGINFAFHNFGDRGSSSVESAGIAGMAHLTQFLGTDNFNSLFEMEEYYPIPDGECAGYSIPATEHSSTTSWGKVNEYEMISEYLETHKDYPIVAAVLDSYDYLEAVNVVTSGDFKERIESEDYPKFIQRPDSGDPIEMIEGTLNRMEANEVQVYTNDKGYKVFKNYGIIWGEGADNGTIDTILNYLVNIRGYSAEIVAFGNGGWLSQQHDRDTQGWAVKCSSITVEEPYMDAFGGKVGTFYEVERDVFKDPITAPFKKSKKGKITTYYNPTTKVFFVDKVGLAFENGSYDYMETVLEDNVLTKEYVLAEVRENSRKD